MGKVRLVTALVLAAFSLAPARAGATEGVSPGAADRFPRVTTTCPTFSWQEAEGTVLYELVAYRLPADDEAGPELRAEDEVLYARVPGGALAWTPSAEQCFASGGRYVWFVRAATEVVGDDIVAAGDWSAGRHFELPAGPTVEELARAVDVIRQWEEANGGRSLPLAAAADFSAAAASRSTSGTWSGSSHPKSVPTASAAVRGEHPGTSGEAYGVLGVSSAADGAGVAAAHLGGGPDLVLDGSADGEVDTHISERGIDRPAPDSETFVVRNSGGGTIVLDVEGTLEANALDCPGCVGAAALASEAVTSYAIEDDGVTAVDIAAGAVDTVHLADGSVQAQDLADRAVTASKIADGAVGAAQIAFESVGESELADEAVTNPKIAPGAIDTNHLANDAVTASKIADGAVGAAQIAFESVGESELADGAVTNPKIAPGEVDTSLLADGAVTGTKLATGSVSSSNIRNNAVTGVHIADEAVGTTEIEDGAVQAADIDARAVGTAHLVDAAVTAAKLAGGAVTSAAIADGAVAATDLGAGVVTSAKLADGAVQTAKLGSGAVTTDKLSISAVATDRISDAAVTNRKLAAGAVTSTTIADGTISRADIAAWAVGSNELADFSVGTSKLQVDAVHSFQIADGTITSADVADGALTSADLDPETGIYSAGADLITHWNQVAVAAGATATVTQRCSSSDDLPLQGHCRSTSPNLVAYSTVLLDWWLSDSSSAGVKCEFKNAGSTTEHAFAEIVCIEVGR